MAFVGMDSWEVQYFKHIDAGGVTVPCADIYSYDAFSEYNWVYNKLALMNYQNIRAAPHGVIPETFPIFSKPIYNLWGMSMGAKRLDDWKEEYYIPGHFWCEFLEGEQLSVDLAVDKGKIKWKAVARATKDKKGSFTRFDITSDIPDKQFNTINKIVEDVFIEYSGILNFEMIGNSVIEIHTRMSPQFVDLYGEGWLESVVKLYKGEGWNDVPLNDGYSCVLRVAEAKRYSIADGYKEHIKGLVSSVQICFKPGEIEIGNDENSYRLAVINGHDLKKCEKAIKIIKPLFV